jgi:phosphonate dehydrogenase
MAFMPDRVDEDFLARCPRLKVIGASLKGYDNFDVEACQQRGIKFSNIPGLLTEPTAELAVALLLGIGRNILPGDSEVRSGRFRGWRPVFYGKGLAGSRVGIIGMGAIGQAVAKRLKGFECRILCTDLRQAEYGAQYSPELIWLPFEELLAQSDFILLVLPLSLQTRHIISAASIEGFKKGAYLVNIGRGSVVDESAVSAALVSGRLAGYAADVFEFEDLSLDDRPENIHPGLLADAGRTLFTPHLGSAVDFARREIAMEAARYILSVLNVTIW